MDQDTQFTKLVGLKEAELREVLALMAGTELTELELVHGKVHLSLRRLVTEAPASGSTTAPNFLLEQIEIVDPPTAITSPLVGFFRPSVRVGDVVKQGQSLGAIEAMGMPTNVEAPRGGTVEELLAAEGDAVEYGQPLLVLRRAEAEPRP